jgi:hypothetical protein
MSGGDIKVWRVEERRRWLMVYVVDVVGLIYVVL